MRFLQYSNTPKYMRVCPRFLVLRLFCTPECYHNALFATNIPIYIRGALCVRFLQYSHIPKYMRVCPRFLVLRLFCTPECLLLALFEPDPNSILVPKRGSTFMIWQSASARSARSQYEGSTYVISLQESASARSARSQYEGSMLLIYVRPKSCHKFNVI